MTRLLFWSRKVSSGSLNRMRMKVSGRRFKIEYIYRNYCGF